MIYFKTLIKTALILLFAGFLTQCGRVSADQWTEDFNHQPVSTRPGLEVKYTDASRRAFQVLAEE